MKVLGISCLTNLAAGLGGEKIDHEEVMETGAKISEIFNELLKRIVLRVS